MVLGPEARERRVGVFDHLRGRIADILWDRPLERVESLDAFVAASTRKRADVVSALILVTSDEEGVHALANLRSQRGDQADVTVFTETFPAPQKDEPEDIWRLRVACAVDEQVRQVEQAYHLSLLPIDYEVIGSDGSIRRERLLDVERETIRREFSGRNLELPIPLPSQPDALR